MKLKLLYPMLMERGISGIFLHVIRRLERFIRRYLGQDKVQKNIHGYKMILDLYDEGLCRYLFHSRTREKDAFYILNNVLHSGMNVLDIGSNIGYYVLLESNIIGESGYIYAIEPISSNCEMLIHNLKINNISGRIKVIRKGISNRVSLEKIYLSSDYCNLHTFCPTFDKPQSDKSPTPDAPTIDVEVTTISDLYEKGYNIDFIRMDIEGYEVEAIQGMQRALENKAFRPGIMFEAHWIKYNDKDHNMRKELKRLCNTGYCFKYLSSNSYNKSKDLFLKKGYQAEKVIWTEFDCKGIYSDLENDDAIDFICNADTIRTVFMATNNTI